MDIKEQETKEEQEQDTRNHFKIIIKGHSGNCSINKDEERFILIEIGKILHKRNIEYFDITMKC